MEILFRDKAYKDIIRMLKKHSHALYREAIKTPTIKTERAMKHAEAMLMGGIEREIYRDNKSLLEHNERLFRIKAYLDKHGYDPSKFKK